MLIREFWLLFWFIWLSKFKFIMPFVYWYTISMCWFLPGTHHVYSEFQLIHELCLYVLSASQRAELIRATLATLHAFLSWIPLGYIFESTLVCTISFFSFLSRFHTYRSSFWLVTGFWLKACMHNRMNMLYVSSYIFILLCISSILSFFSAGNTT